MLPNATNGYSEENELVVLSEIIIKAKEINWKPAILLSATYLEKFGIFRISELLRNRKIKPGKKLDGFSLNDVSIFLYALHQINDKEFTQMNQVRKARNRIIHPRNNKNEIYFGEKADKKYGKMVENTIKIISSLKSD
jgi:hypothetical protein